MQTPAPTPRGEQSTGTMIYLTFTDRYSGVYQSQVIDVARYLRSRFSVRVRVVAIVSIREFVREGSRFRSADPAILVVPMVPGVRNWRWNALLLSLIVLISGDRVLVGRSEFATGIGLVLRRLGLVDRVVFDGRSARTAEVREYQSAEDRPFAPAQVEEWEATAVREADFRIAVSSRLVEYWRERLGYDGDEHVVIPCTLPLATGLRPSTSPIARDELGFDRDRIVAAFAGGSAGWQSFDLLDRFLGPILEADPRISVLLLSDVRLEELEIHRRFPGRIVRRWVSPDRVAEHLAVCDYGLLLREDTVTNRVASPTKFAEYLAAGLDVLISPGLGDLSDFVRRHGCGTVVDPGSSPPTLVRSTPERRRRNRELARNHFEKHAHDASYTRVLRSVGLDVRPPAREVGAP